jgi:hypothetical protein
MVREMHPTLLLPTLFRFVTLLAVVTVRVLFTPARSINSICDLCYDALAVRKRGCVAYSSQEPPPYSPSPSPRPATR